ncbi:MAG TPA: tetratricopeptide repeat protein, partial [Terriglobales bacterium]|nr:tetratricopeptide repeat protein [Terriglobales bacterium]
MAFGFGFNKQKVLSSAEKFVQQGKLQNAISEYEKIIKADSKDLTVMNTVGDLYSRLGESDRAIECFKSVGDAYAQQGFTVKAIAMYKKLSKLRPTLEGSLRLAELYTQQGLFNDARAQYLQVAEEFLRGGELEQAVRIFQKTLEMDPDNVNMRTRLAEVYIRLGKKAEAWDIFATAVESLRGRGALTSAEEILQRMLALDPNNSHALLLRGRLSFDAGDFANAVKNLEHVADLDNHAEGLNVLLQAYLQTGKLHEAGGIANKLATVHNDINGITAYADALIAGGQYESALQMFASNSDRMLAGDSSKILETLHGLIGHLRENTAALEMLLDLLQKAGEQTHLTEIYELLAHAYTQSEQFDKARDYYLKLTQLEPHNQLHAD